MPCPRIMLNESCVRLRVLSRRRRDDAFLARLIADPRATVEEETGLRFPDDYRLHVHEESATVRFAGRCEK